MSLKLELIPTRKQYDFLYNTSKYCLFNGGLGCGKTFIGSWKTILNAYKYPGSITVVFAPTYKMLEDATMRCLFGILPEEGYLFNKSNKKLKLPNGSEIWFRSADNPDTIRGSEVAFVWLDECAMMPESMFKVASGRMRQKGYPHQMWLTSTPKGMNWVYNKFVVNPTSEFWYVTATTFENKYLPEDYVNSLNETYTGQFKRQELFAEFCSPEGLVFSSYNASKHLITLQEEINFVNYYAGIDWGYSDPFALVVCGETDKGELILIDEVYQSKLGYEEQRDITSKMYQKYEWLNCWYDPSNPSFGDGFNGAGIPCVKGDNEVVTGISLVNSYFERNILKVSDKLIHVPTNILQYRYPENEDGLKPNEKPLHPFSHSNDAIRYMIMGIERQRMVAPRYNYGIRDNWF